MTKKHRYRSPYKNTEDYLKRLSGVEEGSQRRIDKINQATDKALEENTIKFAKERIMAIASKLVISNTVSIEEITQLDIQRHTMSEICDLIEEKFGESRLRHIKKDDIEGMATLDEVVYSGEQIVDLSKITKKQLERFARGTWFRKVSFEEDMELFDEVKLKEKKDEIKSKKKEVEKQLMENLEKLEKKYNL
jgi:hypothetical protein